MKDAVQSQFIGSSAASSAVAIFIFLAAALAFVIGAKRSDFDGRGAQEKGDLKGTGLPAFEQKRVP